MIPSIVQRLARTVIVLSVGFGLAAALVIGTIVTHETDALLDDALRESAELLLGLFELEDNDLPDTSGSLPARPHHERVVWQLRSLRDGHVQLRSHAAPDQPLTPVLRDGYASTADGWRVFTLTGRTGALAIQVAQRSSERVSARRELVAATSAGALALGLGLALWLRRRVRDELAPLRRLTDALDRFDPVPAATPRPLAAALPPPEREELVPVHDAIGALAERLARRAAAERAFAAHAAHALRTPLAGIEAQLAVAQREADGALRDRLGRTRAATRRLATVVGALLALFRSGTDAQRVPLRLRELVAQVPASGLALDVADAAFSADPDLVAAALANLLDNAARHGASAVSIGWDAALGAITLDDDGPGVDAARRDDLQRGLDERQPDHAGLGLVLADMVARAHQDRLRLVAGGRGFGLRMGLGTRG
ncbi:histidine kinase dimerization/phospho-acceptor domain-containing protein [Derxia lacustris]|uniref:histidine kinase dimerization/phospho-acceptor domain-containing protein n=1 Tax=Derxia lacustris TaxID=764842 RepID=UPI000A175B67|nr:histidine kinase dimerization/phospho-acceptor domain-containing protein [Derxia lacustris]